VGMCRPRDKEPIAIFVSDGGDACVMDGQHRLAAVALAGVPVELRIRFC
jgi:hypothetical protein